MKRILSGFAANTVFANIVLLMIFLAGGLALSTMLRESFPQFSLDTIIIRIPFPGADPQEVEEGVVVKLEDALDAVEGIKQYTSRAREGLATVIIEVESGYVLADVLDRVKARVNGISTFPADAEQPVITELTMRSSVMLLALSGQLSEQQLKTWAEKVRDDLKLLPGISQVEVFGTRDYEISIEIPQQELERYGLTLSQIAAIINRSSLNLAGGTIRTGDEEIRIRTEERKYTGRELAEIVLLADQSGTLLTLGQIARIRDTFTENPISAMIDDAPAVFVMVFKTTQEDSLRISDTVNHYLQNQRKRLPPGVRLYDFYDNTSALRARIDLLTRNGLLGMGLVFLLLWLFLDLRLSFWGGLGIPISLAGALAILWWLGETINMVSLFGFIMVLGIVVDDAIVVGEAIYVHRRLGKPPLQAAIDGVCEVSMPVTAAVITTVVAFFPLAYVGGIMGKFIAILPTVVIACLVISLVECLLLLPAHLSHLPDLNQLRQYRFPLFRLLSAFQRGVQSGLERFITNFYQPFLERVLTWRYVSLASALAILLVTIGLVLGGIIKFQVFPKIDGFVITATVEFPDGTPVSRTRQALLRIEEAFGRVEARYPTLTGEPLVRERLVLAGQTLGDGIGRSGPHLGSVQIILLESEKRGIHSNDLLVAWEKETGPIAGARSLTFQGLVMGPGGADIEVWLQGRDLDRIVSASRELQEKLHTYAGVSQIRSDHAPGKNEFRLNLKPEARALGLTVEDLARTVRAGFYGAEPLRIQRGSHDIRVKVRYGLEERKNLDTLRRMHIQTNDGRLVPLPVVAEITTGPGYAEIVRTDGLRRVTVTAEVDAKQANATEILADLSANYFPVLKNRYPTLHVSLQGSKKTTRESFSSLRVSFPLAVFGIFVIIATTFRSYVQPLVILFTIPFGIIGAVAGHLLLGYDLSMMSMFGMVALTGVVVNDAIVLIERINENLAEGMEFFTAIIGAAGRRFRAVLLTSLSTIGGLAPLILEKDLQARFLIPMALSLAAGVAFATVLTLLLIPGLLVIVNDFRLLAAKIRSGSWPARETVEPASRRRKSLGS